MNVTCDTSVLVSALRPTQQAHVASLNAMQRVEAVPAHVLLETYSVLTRLPGSERVPEQPLAGLLAGLGLRTLQLPGNAHAAFLTQLGGARITGGASYDALIGAIAKQHECTLLTRDVRAQQTYERLGVSYELVS